MKKIIFSLFAVALLASCGDKTEYTVTGTIKNITVADNSEVYLKKLNDDYRGMTNVDTAVVKNGTFQFKGAQVEPIVRFVEIPQEGQRPMTVLVVLEPGVINVAIDSIPTTGGTPTNDKYAMLSKSQQEQGKEFKALYSKLETATNETEKSTITSEIEKQQGIYKNSLFTFVKENATSQLGTVFFAQNYYMFDLPQLQEALFLIPDSYKGSERYKTIIANVATQEATKVGSKFVDIKGLSPEGKEITLSDYAGKGKVVLVDFWASWCPPCVKDMPHLVAAYAKYKNKGFEIVGVSLDDKPEAWAKGIKDLGITWVQFSDLKGWKSEPAKAYAVSSIPHTVLIDKDGTIIELKIGGAGLDAKLAELLGK